MSISRRTFLKGAALALATLLNPSFSLRSFASTAKRVAGDKALVCIFLRGGNDGLNTVVPVAENAYYDLRPGLAVKENQVLSLNDQNFFALHPSLSGFQELYNSGSMAVFPAAYNSAQNLSHFDSQAIVNSGLSTQFTTGWFARALNTLNIDSSAKLPAISLGFTPHELLVGNSLVSTFPSINSFVGNTDFDLIAQIKAIYRNETGTAPGLSSLISLGLATFDNVNNVRDIAQQKYTPGASYPSARFANQLQEAARLIKNSNVKAITIDQGGFDTHNNQAAAHSALLTLISSSIKAFYDDLGSLKSDVLTLVISEFGRTVAENGSSGTDHGRANAWFAIGGGVKSGVYGEWPGLTNSLDGERYLAQGIDTVDIVSEILVKHLGVTDLSSVFPDSNYSEQGFIA